MRPLPPLSLYVHLPWCVAKCPYCDFNSHKAGDPRQRDDYLHALADDLEHEAGHAAGRRIETIFIGGGTPSLFSPAQIDRLMTMIRGRLLLAGDVEVTMEANPGTVEHGRLEAYREAGITRLSLGAQSFDAGMLRTLGRIHGPDDIVAACEEARRAGFDSINLDLMFALPGQTIDAALADVDRLIVLGPEHISWYQLTLEPNTVFHARPPADLPDDDLAFEIQEAGHARLAAAGYHQYEVSAFSRPGFECRHNLNYWSFGDYLGVGAGAHGKVTTSDWHVLRNRKISHPQAYIEACRSGDATQDCRELTDDERLFDFMLNATRLTGGFTRTGFEARTGLEFEALAGRLASPALQALLASNDGERYRPTALGYRFLNDLQGHFLPTGGMAGAQPGAGRCEPRATSVMHND